MLPKVTFAAWWLCWELNFKRRREQITYAFFYWVCGGKSRITNKVAMLDIGKR